MRPIIIKISEKDLPLAEKLGLKVAVKGHSLTWAGEGHLYSHHDYLLCEEDFIKLMEAKLKLPFAFRLQGDHYAFEVINSYLAWNQKNAKALWVGNIILLFGDVSQKEIQKALEES